MSCIVSFIVDLLLVDIYLCISRQQLFFLFVALNFTSYLNIGGMHAKKNMKIIVILHWFCV